MAASRHGQGPRPTLTHRFSFWATTPTGWWAVGLAAASIVLIPSWRLMGTVGAIPGLARGFAGGLVALVAMTGQRERSITVVASLVPFSFAVVFALAELIVGHS